MMNPQQRQPLSKEQMLRDANRTLKLRRARIQEDMLKVNKKLTDVDQEIQRIAEAKIIPDAIETKKRKPIDGNGGSSIAKRARVDLPRGLLQKPTGKPMTAQELAGHLPSQQSADKLLESLKALAGMVPSAIKSESTSPPPLCPTPQDILLNAAYTDSSAPAASSTESSPPIDLASLFQSLVKNGLIAGLPSTSSNSPPPWDPVSSSSSGSRSSTPSLPFHLPNLQSHPLNASASVFDALLSQTRNFTTPPPNFVPNFQNPCSLQTRNTAAIDVLYPKFVTAERNYSTQAPAPKPSLSDRASLKNRHAPLIAVLYTGMQCSNCCSRFDVKDAVNYQAHLDEHFKENRRERQRSKGGRHWFPTESQWIAYEKFEDEKKAEKPELNWFEKQLQIKAKDAAVEVFGKDLKCIANDDKACCVCSDPLEIYFDDDDEEWMLRTATRVDGKVYHPACHRDLN